MTSDDSASPPDPTGSYEKKDATGSVSMQVGGDINGNVNVGNNNTITLNKNYNSLGYSIVLGSILVVLAALWYREVQAGKYNLEPMAGNLNVAVARFTDWTEGKHVLQAARQ
jgi:hypothetical protein